MTFPTVCGNTATGGRKTRKTVPQAVMAELADAHGSGDKVSSESMRTFVAVANRCIPRIAKTSSHVNIGRFRPAVWGVIYDPYNGNPSK